MQISEIPSCTCALELCWNPTGNKGSQSGGLFSFSQCCWRLQNVQKMVYNDCNGIPHLLDVWEDARVLVWSLATPYCWGSWVVRDISEDGWLFINSWQCAREEAFSFHPFLSPSFPLSIFSSFHSSPSFYITFLFFLLLLLFMWPVLITKLWKMTMGLDLKGKLTIPISHPAVLLF